MEAKDPWVWKTRSLQEAARAIHRPAIRVDGDERYSEEKLTGWFDPPAVVLPRGYVLESF